MMMYVRRIASTRHPLVLGGGVSGALVAATVAAFVSITALVSSSDLPGGIPTLSPVRSGTMTLPSRPASSHQAHAAARVDHSAPLALPLPTASTVAPPSTSPAPLPVVVATATGAAVRLVADAAGDAAQRIHHQRRSAGSGQPGHGQGVTGAQAPGGVEAKVSSSSSSTSSGGVTTDQAVPETGVAKTAPGGTSAPSTAPAPAPAPPSSPPGLQSKPGGLPPGLAKKPGGVPPGLAKKPGGIPPGQAKH